MVDDVYVMKEGRVVEHGSYKKLLSHNGEFSQFVKTYFNNGKRLYYLVINDC